MKATGQKETLQSRSRGWIASPSQPGGVLPPEHMVMSQASIHQPSLNTLQSLHQQQLLPPVRENSHFLSPLNSRVPWFPPLGAPHELSPAPVRENWHFWVHYSSWVPWLLPKELHMSSVLLLWPLPVLPSSPGTHHHSQLETFMALEGDFDLLDHKVMPPELMIKPEVLLVKWKKYLCIAGLV